MTKRLRILLTIPCHGRQHRIILGEHNRLSFRDHSRTSVHLESLLAIQDGCAAVYATLTKGDTLSTLPPPLLAIFERTYDAIVNAIHDEWRLCHHNARLPILPYDDHESDLFWDHLGYSLRDACKTLSYQLKKDYDISLTFYQYGRSGATIAPNEWMTRASCNGFGGFNSDILQWTDEPDCLIYAQRILTVLEIINAYWRTTTTSIEEWWREERRVVRAENRAPQHRPPPPPAPSPPHG